MFKTGEFPPLQNLLSRRRILRFGRLGDESRPRLAGFRRDVPLRVLIGRRRDDDQMLAGRTLDLPATEAFVALQVLRTVRARELELAHAGSVTEITAKLQIPKWGETGWAFFCL